MVSDSAKQTIDALSKEELRFEVAKGNLAVVVALLAIVVTMCTKS